MRLYLLAGVVAAGVGGTASRSPCADEDAATVTRMALARTLAVPVGLIGEIGKAETFAL